MRNPWARFEHSKYMVHTPSGAGLAQAADERLSEVVNAALRIVTNYKDYTPDSSCYSCIRTYSNQWQREHLTCEHAIHVLEDLNENLQHLVPN